MLENLPISDYAVVTAANVGALATAVKVQLDLGWTLNGAPFTDGTTNLFQGMVMLGPQTQVQN